MTALRNNAPHTALLTTDDCKATAADQPVQRSETFGSICRIRRIGLILNLIEQDRVRIPRVSIDSDSDRDSDPDRLVAKIRIAEPGMPVGFEFMD
jgi:hypothetical protein